MSAAPKRTMPFFPVKEISSTTSVTLAKILHIDFGQREAVDWEVRPCGMLVQRRDAEPAASTAPLLPICVRVKHDSVYHDICISSRSTFGELKKLVLEEIGLRPREQKLLFKNKVMDPAAFLDVAGVKGRSNLVLVDDPIAQARRVLETRRALNDEKAGKLVGKISTTVDRHALQVSAMKSDVGKGKKVKEGDVLRLTGLLMDQLVRLESLRGTMNGDVKLEWRAQVRKVQRLVEALDVLNIKYSTPADDASATPQPRTGRPPRPPPPQQMHREYASELKRPQARVAGRKWGWGGTEAPSTAQAASLATVGKAAAAAVSTSTIEPIGAPPAPAPNLNWVLFS